MPQNIPKPSWVKLEPKLDCMPPEILDKILSLAIPERVNIAATHLSEHDWQQHRPFEWRAWHQHHGLCGAWINDCHSSGILLISKSIRRAALKIFRKRVDFDFIAKSGSRLSYHSNGVIKTKVRRHFESIFAGADG
ncbi:uncharacterized protein AB675_11685 [Cyphellophora attinorum]|uniref:Uncharacterized protein n=1 Tax=Cyphellophora attinorum TaxID=1664694 RepID=A0A0N0NI58_9EURO|nr:uncharacterized protein AB675_11685 [Phialophora attinorum]KPI35461.1 hypothetical protein AB675_11685 [Phialophora attinorum]